MVMADGMKREEDVELQLQLLAWQTSHIMNSSGNYKKPIKPEHLYKPQGDSENETSKELRPIDRDEKNKQLEALMNKFN
jgi:hypothetical protein